MKQREKQTSAKAKKMEQNRTEYEQRLAEEVRLVFGLRLGSESIFLVSISKILRRDIEAKMWASDGFGIILR